MTTPIASIPEIAQNQAAKYVTHNEALRQLEALNHGSVIDRTLTAPPVLTSPGDDGKVYIPASGASGAWNGQDQNIAVFKDDGWVFYPFFENLIVYSIPDSALIINQSGSWSVFSSGGSTTGEIKISANDTTLGFPIAKLVQGDAITLTENNDGGNETLTIASTGQTKVSSNDTTVGYLNGKLLQGTNITLVEGNDGGDETLTINSTAGGTDELAKVSANDTTAGFLNGKLIQGTNITLVENNDGGNETLTINSTGGGGTTITLETNLQGWWELADDNTWADSTTNNNDLTEAGTVTTNTGIIGDGAEFTNTASQALYIASAPASFRDATEMTISAWVNFDTLTANQTIVSIYNDSGNDRKFRIDYRILSDSIQFVVSPDGSNVKGYLPFQNLAISTSTWYHLALVIENTTAECYINGNREAFHLDGTLHTPTTAEFTIGNETSTESLAVDGIVDQVGFWDRRLTIEEILYLYNNGSARSFGDLTESIESFDKLARASITDQVSSYLKDKLQGTGDLSVAVSNSGANERILIASSSNTTDLLTNLQGWWELADDGIWADSSGNGNSLTEFGTITTATGIIGDGAEFTDSGGTTLYIASTPSNIGDETTFSFSLWFNADVINSNAALCALYNPGTNQRKYQLRLRTNPNILQIVTSADGIDNASHESTFELTLNTWYHVVCIITPSTVDLYVNNYLDSFTIDGILGANSTQFSLGNRTPGSGDGFDGTIDQVGFWNRQLNPVEVDFLYNNGAARTFNELDTSESPSLSVNTLRTDLQGYWELDDDNTWADSSGNGNSLTENGTITTATGIVGDGAELTNAASQALFIASAPAIFNTTEKFTVSAWVKFDVINVNQSIVSMWSASNRKFRLSGFVIDGVSTFKISADISSTGSDSRRVVSEETITSGVFIHTVLVFEDSHIRLYVNNNVVELFSNIGNTFTGGTSEFTIGNEISTDTDSLDGVIDEVGFWSRALTPEEINYLYNDGAGRAYSATDVTVTKIDNTTNAIVKSTQNDRTPAPLFNKILPTNNLTIRQFNPETNTALLLEIDRNLRPNLRDSLEAYWALESNGNDSSGNGNNLTVSVVGYASGLIGNGLNFTRTTSESAFTTAESIRDATVFSISMWFNLNTIHTSGNDVFLLGIYNTTFNERKLRVFIETTSNAGEFVITTGADGTNQRSQKPDWDIKVNTWYHFVLVIDGTGGTVNAYLNNKKDTWEVSGIQGNIINTAFTIGNRSANNSLPFDGLIDEVGFWTRTLTPVEVDYLYNQGSGITYAGLEQGEPIPRRTLTAAANVAVDAEESKVFNLTLNQNVIIDPPSNLDDGDELTFRILQNGTGGFTVTWNAIYKGTIPTMTATASNMDIFKFHVVNGSPIYYATQQAITGVTF